jgi:putative transposase
VILSVAGFSSPTPGIGPCGYASFEAGRIRIIAVKRTDRAVKGFIVLPKRWIVERTFRWLNWARRLAKNFEALVDSSQAWLMLAFSSLLVRRIT